jgi:hypothetical protein
VINFKLKDFDKIIPVGQEPDLRLSWFWLTDGDLWLKFGEQTIYEYSKEALQHFGHKETPYNDYYIVRFLEDFTERFEKISVSIPENFYKLTENLKQFRNETQKWLDIYDTDEDEYSDFYLEEYDKLISWTYERLFDSGHLIGGLHLSFFRHKDKIRIVWETEHTLENGIILWTAKDGNFEMNYSDFINQVRIFGQNFFEAMDKQIDLTLTKDWENIKVDKERLVEEHKERKIEFNKNLSFLEQGKTDETDWTGIEKLYERMKNEIK